MKLSSPIFNHEEMIPSKYSCKGDDISPPLKWEDPPSGTQSFVLICDDPDAPMGTWDHWIVFNIPAKETELPEDIPSQNRLPNNALHGQNSWGRNDYGGPCPPSGIHRYFFKLYALDILLDLEAGANKNQVMEKMEGHILENCELMGRFQK